MFRDPMPGFEGVFFPNRLCEWTAAGPVATVPVGAILAISNGYGFDVNDPGTDTGTMVAGARTGKTVLCLAPFYTFVLGTTAIFPGVV